MAVEEGGTIAPVANRGDSRFDKQRRATDRFETLDGAILADYSTQTNRSFQALLAGIWRVRRGDISEELSDA